MNSTELKCKKCGIVNDASRYFCEKCGSFLRTDKVKDFQLYESSQMKIMRILENLKYYPHSEIIWDDTTDLYAKQIERLDALISLPEINGKKMNSSVTENMERFLSMCRTPEFQIAFVGTIKTGKSTLINALLGKNYASMDVTPETAALTKFRYSKNDFIKVSFYSQNEWKALWGSCSSSADAFLKEYKELNAESIKDKWIGHKPLMLELKNEKIQSELVQWSSSKYAEHYFVKEIEVGISTLPKGFPSQVIFVDTPGLSDPVAYRSEITRDYIKKANAVFVCVEAQKMHKEETETISSVFSFSSHNKRKVHIIATHWDNLNDPIEDWQKQIKYLESHLVGKGFFDDVEDARSNIMPSSAIIYNLCRDFDLLEDKQKKLLRTFAIKMDLDPRDDAIRENLSEFKKYANIDRIMERITNVLARNYKTLLNQDIGNLFKQIKFDLTRIGLEKKEQAQNFIDASDSDVETLKKKLQQQEKNKTDIGNAQKRLVAILQSVQKETNDRMVAVLSALDSCLEGKKTTVKKMRLS